MRKNNDYDEQAEAITRGNTIAARLAQAPHKFPLKPYLGLARKVFEDAQGSNDMGVIADLLETKAHAQRLADALKRSEKDICDGRTIDAVRGIREAIAQWEASN